MWGFVLGLGCLVFLFGVPSVCAQCLSADVVLNNGHIITMDGQRSVVSALAIRDGRVEALGSWNCLFAPIIDGARLWLPFA